MSRGSPAWRLENGHQIFSELCHVVGETEEQLELSLNIEFEGDVGRRIRHAEQRTRGELPFGHAVFELKIRDRPHPVLLLFETALTLTIQRPTIRARFKKFSGQA